jgi:hypothetical protein
MSFVLTGFTHDQGFRVFAFDRIGADRVRTKCSVRADLALIRVYGIHIQELPLLCRDLLDRRADGDETQPLTFTEEEMRTNLRMRDAARAAAASKRRPPAKGAAGNASNTGNPNVASPIQHG